MHIRYATTDDVPTCAAIARRYPKELAFVSNVRLRDGVARQELYVAEVSGEVVGFALFHVRRDGWVTLYDLASISSGAGALLLAALPRPLQLKVKVDNHRARAFYTCNGLYFRHYTGSNLAVYYQRVLPVFIAGKNAQYPIVAAASGMAYGVAQNDTPYAPITMLDVDFTQPDWEGYVTKYQQLRPAYAFAVDYSGDTAAMLAQVSQLRQLGALNVIVPIKGDGLAVNVPVGCVLGVSVPAKSDKFGGFLPKSAEGFFGRKVHLLGGTPSNQLHVQARLAQVGATVASADYNAHEKAARRGTIWVNGRWDTGHTGGYYDLTSLSGRLIAKELNGRLPQLGTQWTKTRRENERRYYENFFNP